MEVFGSRFKLQFILLESEARGFFPRGVGWVRRYVSCWNDGEWVEFQHQLTLYTANNVGLAIEYVSNLEWCRLVGRGPILEYQRNKS